MVIPDPNTAGPTSAASNGRWPVSGPPDTERAPRRGQPLYLNEIRQRAYQKWLAAGQPEGNGTRFWLEAEQELLRAK
jgi:hypothetical protein